MSRDTELDRSTIWPYEQGGLGPVYYSRDGHPTGIAAEEALGKLEGGRALLFSSGMAASTTAVLTMAGPGKTVALAAGCYYGTGGLFRSLERWGLQVVEFDQTGPPPDGADLIWIEGPSNPFLTFPDLEAAAAHTAPVVFDATAATPVLLRPLDHGVDVVMHSATKYLAGHHDALLGALVCRDEALFEELRRTRTRTGPTAAPDSAWLLHRSLKTLDLRVRRQSETALEIARLLSAHPRVETVRYPGLGPDPVAARYLQGGFGGMLSFDVADADAARRVETSTKLIENATSLGGVDTTIEGRFRWEGERVPPGLLRLSVGLEDVDAIWADLDQALAQA
ncbi:MAG TPA: PLP-dependent transferase [Gaiellaceae bacterium]|nr:PLP-dependent transferase [Gaiellaceae bacterium]